MSDELDAGTRSQQVTGSLTASDVTVAYQLFFDREPESAAVIAHHMARHKNLQTFRAALFSSKEFRERFSVAPVTSGSKPLNGPYIKVDVDVSDSQLSDMIRLVEGNWEELGRVEPHWSVLTDGQFRSANIQDNKELFYRSGQNSTELMTLAAKRCGLDMSSLSTCLELGCGVGRVTVWLSQHFRSIIAIDISRPHISLAEDAARQRGISNINFIHMNSPNSLESLPNFDALFSVIVLQHNPPPVIFSILDTLLPKLNPNGVAYFQVPTYRFDYNFDATEYLASATVRGQMEMHVLPQPVLFSLFAKHDCRVLEVREDAWTGSPKVISNSFLIQKLRIGRRREAIDAANSAAALAPDDPHLLAEVGSLLADSNRFEEFEEAALPFKQATDLAPGDLALSEQLEGIQARGTSPAVVKARGREPILPRPNARVKIMGFRPMRRSAIRSVEGGS